MMGDRPTAKGLDSVSGCMRVRTPRACGRRAMLQAVHLMQAVAHRAPFVSVMMFLCLA